MRPIQLMHNRLPQQLIRKLSFRKILAAFQFALSLLFIIAVTIMYRQYRFSLNHDLGFTRENLLNIPLKDSDPEIFRQTFAGVPGVLEISFSSLLPGTGSTSSAWVQTPGMQDSLPAYWMSVDHRFIPNYGLALAAGQNFPDQMPSGEEHFILVNEQFVRAFSWTSRDAPGQTMLIDHLPHRIIGVVRDFNYTHLEEPIQSFFLRYQPERFAYASLKINTPDIQTTLTGLEAAWDQIRPGQTFEARFLEDQIEEAYLFLLNNVQLFGFLAFVAISIACLGLLGMAVYTTEVRLKEISIRKVFGAGEWRLVRLLSSGFIQILAGAALFAVPLAWYLFDQLILNNFAFRIAVGPVELGAGILLLFALGFLTIVSQTWKAARANPAGVLGRSC